ncbi:MAG TPA: regulatory protein RecX [Saprospiraceae bacterium]|nr:regulatory protein RecX [Saprospiraceae bacterium]HNT19679.1 regulatory protein RecX [Saprospiraceae bacterium]
MKPVLTNREGLELLRQYCNYQERCHQEVRSKGLKLGFRGDDLEELISAMITEGLLDEERYARSLARGKFRNNQWGRVKIIQALKMHNIPEYCIRKALTEIDESEYRQTLLKLAELKNESLPGGLSDYEKKQKVISYLMQKGYEFEAIESALGQE